MYIPKTQHLLTNDAGVHFHFLDKVVPIYDYDHMEIKYGVVESTSGSGKNLLIKWHQQDGRVSPEEIWEPNALKLFAPTELQLMYKLELYDDGKQQYYRMVPA